MVAKPPHPILLIISIKMRRKKTHKFSGKSSLTFPFQNVFNGTHFGFDGKRRNTNMHSTCGHFRRNRKPHIAISTIAHNNRDPPPRSSRELLLIYNKQIHCCAKLKPNWFLSKQFVGKTKEASLVKTCASTWQRGVKISSIVVFQVVWRLKRGLLKS